VRFLVDPSEARLARARAPVRAFLAFAALAVAALLLQRATGGGLSPAEVDLHYLGTGEGDALPRAALWEELHAGAFLYGFVLFMLGSILGVCRLRPALRTALFAGALTAALADLGAPFLVVALGGGGALRVATTLAATVALAAAIAVTFVTFGPAPANGKANG
jgi:hypothetical protein